MKKIITYLILLFTDLKRMAELINQEGMTSDKLDAEASREVWGES